MQVNALLAEVYRMACSDQILAIDNKEEQKALIKHLPIISSQLMDIEDEES